MTYTVFCTFDLKRANSQDYENAYSDLSKIGLKRVVVARDDRQIVIPTTSVIGYFNGTGLETVRDDLRERVQSAFRARGFSSEIFVLVGSNTTWGAATT